MEQFAELPGDPQAATAWIVGVRRPQPGERVVERSVVVDLADDPVGTAPQQQAA
jgi:hypothetical protein